MTTPFTTLSPAHPFAEKTPAKLASDRSIRYMTDLAMDKAAHEGQDEQIALDNIAAWAEGRSQTEVSEQIGRLKSLGYTGRKYVGQDKTEEPTAPAELEAGFYELTAGMVVKVQLAVHGSGNLYAKRLNTETGKFEYQPGLINLVRERGTRLTVERARELGQLYGMCIRCGATLTDEDSIERGMGPVCAGKGF